MVASPAQAAPIDLLTVSDASNWEGGDLTFTVTYTGTASAEFDFDILDVDTSGSDYTGPTSAYFGAAVGHTESISFGASSTSTPIMATVKVHATTGTTESDETFKLRAVAHSGDPDADAIASGTGTIWEPDAGNHIALSGDTTVAETATNGVQKSVTITASQTNPQQHDVVIPVKTALWTGGTDTWTDEAISTGGANRDYTALPSDATITIPANATVGTTTVQLWDDTADEGDTQYFDVKVDNLGSRAVLGGDIVTNQGTVHIGITDDDAAPTVTIGDAATVKEGAPLTFPVTLSNPSEKSTGGNTGVTVKLAAVGLARGNAVAAIRGYDSTHPADGDFVWGTNGALASNTQQVVTVPRYAKSTNVMITTTTNDDGSFEGPENVNATLSTPTDDVTLGTTTAANGVITDQASELGQTVLWSAEDPFVGGNKTYPEGNAGSVAQKIYLKFSTGTLPTTFNYSFVDGTAKNGSDYTGTAGSISVPASDAATPMVSIPITVLGDRFDEPDETFKLHVTDPNAVANAANIGDVTFTIHDDDAAPSWSTQDVSVKEGDSGQTMAHIPVTLGSPVASDATFTAVISNGNAVDTGATPGANDFDAPTTLSTTVKAGESKAYFDVPVNGDSIFEKDEAFTVAFTPPATIIDNSSLDIVSTSRVTITNDDAAPKLTFPSISGVEGGTASVNATIVGASQAPYEIGFTAAGSGTAPATVAKDFELPAGLASTTYTIPSGFTGLLTALPSPYNTFSALQFPLDSDNVDEATETFSVTATETSSTLQGFVTSSGTVKIADDPLDLPPSAAIEDVSIGEWEKTVDVPVDLTFASDNDATSTEQTVMIPYYTVDGSAKAGEDYKATKGTLEVKPGTLKANINVPVIDDKNKESNEDFYVKLGTPSPAGSTVTKSAGNVIIKDNDKGGSTPPSNGEGPSISAPSWVTGAVAVPISGTADAGATVDLWGAPWSPANPKLTKLATTEADDNGHYKFSRWIGTGYRFQAAASNEVSNVIKVGIMQSPVFVLTSPSKGKISLAVQGNPRGPKQSVVIERLVNGKWVDTKWKGSTGSDSRWKATVSEPSKSKWTLRASVAGDASRGIKEGTSAAKSVTVKS